MRGPLQIRVLLTDPGGTEHELTQSVTLDTIGRVSETVEQDLLQVTHADVDLEIMDRDGAWAALLGQVTHGQVWQVVIEIEESAGHWRRVFAGVLDTPYSVLIDEYEQTVGLHVFGWSKLLELFSAEVLRRDLSGRTCTIGSGATAATFSDTTGFVAGDRFKLNDNEEFTVLAVTSGTTLTTTVAATAAYTGATVTPLTEYYRLYSVAQLAQMLFALAGITDYDVDIAQELFATPGQSALQTSGLPTTAPTALTERTTAVAVWTGGNRYQAATPSSGFGAGTADTAKSDWRPYATSEPATLRAANTTDEGTRAWDYAGNHYYELATSGNDLLLKKDGATIATVVTKGVNDDPISYALDVDNAATEIWVSYWYKRNNAIPEFLDWRSSTKVYDATGALLRTPNGDGGYLRAIRATSQIAFLPASLTGLSFADGIVRWNQPVRLYASGTSTVALTLDAVGLNAEDTDDRALLWTLRAMDSHLLCVRRDAGKTYVSVWQQSDGALVSDSLVSSSITATNLATVWDAGATATYAHYIVFAGGVWATFSREFSGVVPYADFSGMSAAAALRELALISGSYFTVTPDKVGILYGRRSTKLDSTPRAMEEPLRRPRRPISPWLRTGVKVTGETETGDAIDVSSGSLGDSALTLTVELQIPVTAAYAAGLASAYERYLSRLGQQIDAVVRMPADGRWELFQRAEYSGVTYRVLRVVTDYSREEQQLQLVQEDA